MYTPIGPGVRVITAWERPDRKTDGGRGRSFMITVYRGRPPPRRARAITARASPRNQACRWIFALLLSGTVICMNALIIE
jgi:hypothetical protein